MAKKLLSREELEQRAKAGEMAGEVQVRKQFICEDIKKVEKAEGDAVDVTRRRTFVISTGSVDRDNDTISVNGWKLENYKRNPVVLFAHDYDSLPIGKCVEIGINGDKLLATAEFADHAMADTCLKLVDGGFLRATSVGFRPMKFTINEERRGLDFVEQELLEFSVVPVPANPEALMVSREFGSETEQLLAWAKEMTDKLSKKLVETPAPKKTAEQVEKVEFDFAKLPGLIADAVKAALAPTPVTCSACSKALDDSTSRLIEGTTVTCFTCLPEEKRGRVLSSANEGRIRQAKGHLDEVLAQLDKPADQTGEDTAEEQALELSDEGVEKAGDEDVIELAEDIDADDIREALTGSLKDIIRDIVQQETQATMNRLRGKVD